jgi:hypothetical protein
VKSLPRRVAAPRGESKSFAMSTLFADSAVNIPRGAIIPLIISEHVSEQLTPSISFQLSPSSRLGQTLVAPPLISRGSVPVCLRLPLLIAILLCSWRVTSHVAQLALSGLATIALHYLAHCDLRCFQPAQVWAAQSGPVMGLRNAAQVDGWQALGGGDDGGV